MREPGARRFGPVSALRHRGPRRPSRHADPRTALSGYLEAIRSGEAAGLPPPPAALNGMGDAHLDLGDEAQADACYLRAADAYAAEGLHDNAIACCRKILRRSAAHVRAGLALGRSCAAKGLRAEALAVLEAVAERCHGTGDPRGALDVQEEVVRIAPEDPRARERLARLLQDAGRCEEARREYRNAREICLQAGDPAGAEHARTRLEALGG